MKVAWSENFKSSGECIIHVLQGCVFLLEMTLMLGNKVTWLPNFKLGVYIFKSWFNLQRFHVSRTQYFPLNVVTSSLATLPEFLTQVSWGHHHFHLCTQNAHLNCTLNPSQKYMTSIKKHNFVKKLSFITFKTKEYKVCHPIPLPNITFVCLLKW